MLAVITVLCLYLGWAMNWRRQRHNFLQVPNVQVSEHGQKLRQPLPFSLRIVGETPLSVIIVTITGQPEGEQRYDEASHLFPESFIVYESVPAM